MAKRRANNEGGLTKRKDGRWYGSVAIGNRERKSFYGRTQEDVAEKMSRFREDFKRAPQYQKSTTVLSEYAESWLEHEVRPVVSKRTHSIYSGELGKNVLPHIGELKLRDITPQVVREMQVMVLESSGPVAARNARARLFTIMQLAYHDGILPRNPVESVKPIKAPPRQVDVWTEADILAFVNANGAHALYPMYYLALMTGLRPSEYLALRWCDIGKDEVRVRQALKQPKGGLIIESASKTPAALRDVPLPEDAAELVQTVARERAVGIYGRTFLKESLVFPSVEATVYNPTNVRERYWLSMLRAARLDEVRPYVTRHTYASMNIAAGMDAATLALYMGHVSSSFTMKVYVSHFERRNRAKPKTLAELLNT